MNQPHILLRSSWQSVNIGDIGHTPGILALLQRHIPEARVTLWPCEVGNGVKEMLLKSFPDVEIVEGTLEDGQPSTPELASAWERATFFLHGSGPSLVRQGDMEVWAATGQPYGVYGITIEPNSHVGNFDARQAALLSGASFVFTRETASLGNLQAAGVQCPCMEFAPDATFSFHLHNEALATDYLRRSQLEGQPFIAAIPRLRYTPYYQILGRQPNAEDLRRKAISDEFETIDHQKLARALESVVRATGVHVLACPEMTYEVPLAKSLLIDPQPEDVRSHFVWRDHYWRPDEAASVYAHASAVISLEMHSPIIAASVGVPAIYLRQPTDTIKGQMWRDVGLADWIFEIDETDETEIAEKTLQILNDRDATKQKLERTMEFVARRHHETMAVVKKAVLN